LPGLWLDVCNLTSTWHAGALHERRIRRRHRFGPHDRNIVLVMSSLVKQEHTYLTPATLADAIDHRRAHHSNLMPIPTLIGSAP
jgi:hypothetical protein